ncbi:hypothetical protein SMMN14_09581 [Sphaerulina musiva]
MIALLAPRSPRTAIHSTAYSSILRQECSQESGPYPRVLDRRRQPRHKPRISDRTWWNRRRSFWYSRTRQQEQRVYYSAACHLCSRREKALPCVCFTSNARFRQ